MRKMQYLMESCYAKTVMSGVMGFGLGGMFGAFMASVSFFERFLLLYTWVKKAKIIKETNTSFSFSLLVF